MHFDLQVGEPPLTVPGALVYVKASYRGLKVARVGEAVCAQGPKFGELIVRAENLLNVCTNGPEPPVKFLTWWRSHPREGPSGTETCIV